MGSNTRKSIIYWLEKRVEAVVQVTHHPMTPDRY